jgi:hypothetical protein
MKIPTIILLFVAIGCYAGDTSDITQNVLDRTNLFGTREHFVTTYRGTKKVMTEIFSPGANGKLVITSRSYLVGGDLVILESAEHTPGKLDSIFIYNPRTDAMEAFTRQADGSVKPVNTHLLLAYQQEHATVSDLFKTLNNTNTTEEQWEAKVQEIKKKVQEIQKKVDAEKQNADDGH